MIRSTTSRNRLAATAVACGLCLGVAAPVAFATTPVPMAGQAQLTVPELPADSIRGWKSGSAPQSSNDLLGQWLNESGGKAIVIVTPGTDDVSLLDRNRGLVGDRDWAHVKYPESFGPIIAGKSDAPLGLPFFAPGYTKSRKVAEANNLAIMNSLTGYTGPVVYTGFSQGAEALGNAAEQGSKDGILGSNVLILLVSDPRSPWGIKGWARDLPLSDVWLTPTLGIVGIDNNGARNPEDTGDVQVLSVIVQGDPATDWQWNWLRPGSSLLVNAAGFLAIHSPGDGPYGHLDGSTNKNGQVLVLGEPVLLQSEDGNTTYAVYDTYHPLALLNAMIYDALGLKYGKNELERWDVQAEFFYPMTDVADKKTYGGVKVAEGDGGLQQIGALPTAAEGTPPGNNARPVLGDTSSNTGAGDLAPSAGRHELGSGEEPMFKPRADHVPEHGTGPEVPQQVAPVANADGTANGTASNELKQSPADDADDGSPAAATDGGSSGGTAADLADAS